MTASSTPGMKGLVLDTIVTQQQPAVGEHAVHIEYHEFQVRSPRQNFGRCAHGSNYSGAQQIVHDQNADKPVLGIDHQ